MLMLLFFHKTYSSIVGSVHFLKRVVVGGMGGGRSGFYGSQLCVVSLFCIFSLCSLWDKRSNINDYLQPLIVVEIMTTTRVKVMAK